MGVNNLGTSFEHVTIAQAMRYFLDFYTNYFLLGILWHRYVFAEHVKFIAEYSPSCELFFGRSIYRSNFHYAWDTELFRKWWIGYIAKWNDNKTELIIVTTTNEITEQEFRKRYKACGLTGNF